MNKLIRINVSVLAFICLFTNFIFAKDTPNVPDQYRKFFVHYVDKRSYKEKILNSFGLQNMGRSFALIAGVSSYPSLPSEQQLEPAAEDMRKLEDYLKRVEFFDEVVVLKDQNMNYDNLQFFLQYYFPERLTKFPKSRFLFAYSGHGFNEGTDGFLLLSAAKSSQDKQNSMKLHTVRSLFSEVLKPGFHVLALINACHSGAFIKQAFGVETKPRLPKNKGAHVITAGGTFELAWHYPTIGSGSVFFEKFFEGLNGDADTIPKGGDGIITSEELGAYLRQEVQFATDQIQNPLIYDLLDESLGSFFFLNRARQLRAGTIQQWDANAIPSGVQSEVTPTPTPKIIPTVTPIATPIPTPIYTVTPTATIPPVGTSSKKRIDSPDEQPTATPLTTVSPVSTPSETTPLSLINEQLEIADSLMKERKLTTPPENNAFDIYKKILSVDPINLEAKEKVYEIIKIYKAWGDTASEQTVYDKAQQYYQRYMVVSQFITSVLGDTSINSEVEEVQKQLQQLEELPLSAPPVQKETQTVSQNSLPLSSQQTLSGYIEQYRILKQNESVGINANNQIIAIIRSISELLQEGKKVSLPVSPEDIEQLMEEANRYFQYQQFTVPEGANAYTLYKKVLSLDPTHWEAWEKIYAIAGLYRISGYKKATQEQGQYISTAGDEQYKQILDHLLNVLENHFNQVESSLLKAKDHGDRKEQVLQTLRMVEILRKFKKIYEQFSEEDFGSEQPLKRTEDAIQGYEKQLLK